MPKKKNESPLKLKFPSKDKSALHSLFEQNRKKQGQLLLKATPTEEIITTFNPNKNSTV
jgi:hypothetical protein